MAVTKTLSNAVPYNLNSKVQEWELTMDYKQGNKSATPPTYYQTEFSTTIPATSDDGTVHFTPKPEADWTKAELIALCPTTQWDAIFASQYDSVITNPPDNPVPDPDYVIPS